MPGAACFFLPPRDLLQPLRVPRARSCSPNEGGGTIATFVRSHAPEPIPARALGAQDAAVRYLPPRPQAVKTTLTLHTAESAAPGAVSVEKADEIGDVQRGCDR